MAKKSVTINGRVEMVEYSPARQGGTLLMPSTRAMLPLVD